MSERCPLGAPGHEPKVEGEVFVSSGTTLKVDEAVVRYAVGKYEIGRSPRIIHRKCLSISTPANIPID